MPFGKRRGDLSTFVARHQFVWELSMAVLTALYVGLSVIVDTGAAPLVVTVGIASLAVVFFAEFMLRFLDSRSRLLYLKNHWIDLATCVPFIGPLRVLRLLRLLGLLRLAHEIRQLALVRAEGYGTPQSLTWVVWPTALLLWLGAAEGLWIVERGHNPAVHSFGDVLYMAFITASTVGYGDFRPVTPEGKVIAGALVFFGLGLLGFISAQLTARWLRVEGRERVIESQLAALRSDIADLKAHVSNAGTGPESTSTATSASEASSKVSSRI